MTSGARAHGAGASAGAAAPAGAPAGPLLHLAGEWTGAGHGSYPSIADFDYLETVRFARIGDQPVFVYSQRTRHPQSALPMHREDGYLRMHSGGAELIVVQPTGIAEVDEGPITETATGFALRLSSTSVGHSASAKTVTEVVRVFRLAGDLLHTDVAIAAVGYPLTHHLSSVLRRVASA